MKFDSFMPAAGYHRSRTDTFWSPEGGPTSFAYSDGDEVENRIAGFVNRTDDLSTGSEALMSHISDWPTLYHLSSARSNLLRPLESRLKGKSVLEIGAGCGAITRYLGECAAQVVGIEGSSRRAAICAARCRGLDNVAVVCDSFEAFSSPARFDVVTLIGVLEYSRMFSDAEDPVTATLKRCADLLAHDGILIIAIENQLGLKYLAGAPEDHSAQTFFGINDLYGARTPVTFGRAELGLILKKAGLPHAEVLAPFPDYKLPSVLVHERAFLKTELDLTSILRSLPARAQAFPYQRTFSEEMSWAVFLRNGLGLDVVNSFLFVASRERTVPSQVGGDGPDVWIYSTDRQRCFAKEKTLSARGADVDVRIRPLYGIQAPEAPYVQSRNHEEPYRTGEPYSLGFYRIVNHSGWTLRQVADWARPWAQWLAGLGSGGFHTDAVVPADYLDAIPRNLMLSPQGEFLAFDLEWRAPTDLSLGYMVYRGLLSAFRQSGSVALPHRGLRGYVRRHGIPHGVLNEIVGAVFIELGLSADRDVIGEYVRREQAFQLHVLGPQLFRSSQPYGSSVISVRDGTIADVDLNYLARASIMRLREGLIARLTRS